MKKYEILKEDTIKCNGKTLYRIRALGANKGELGGYIEKESNLSHKGNAWVGDDAKVYDEAKVYGDALVCGAAEVFDHANIYGNAKVHGAAKVYGNTDLHAFAEVS